MFIAPSDINYTPKIELQKTNLQAAKTPWESLEDAWDEQRFSGNAYSRQNNIHNEYAEYIKEVENITGEKLENPYDSAFFEFAEDVTEFMEKYNPIAAIASAPRRLLTDDRETRNNKKIGKFYRKLRQLKQQYPELEIKTLDDVENNIKKKAQELRDKKALGQDENGLMAFIGTTAGAMSDPFNATATLLTAPFTAGTTGTLLSILGRTAAIEGGINMGIEAINQVPVTKYKKELGDEYGLGDAIGAVATAGIGGAVLGVGVRGTGSLLKRAVERVKTLKEKGLKLSQFEEDVLKTAEERAELDDFLHGYSPFDDEDILNDWLERNMSFEQQRLLWSKERSELAEAWEKMRRKDYGDNPHEVLSRITRENMSDIVFERGEWTKAIGDSKTGYGMVKFVWKHGELKHDDIPIMKDDILRFPEIVDKKMPMTMDVYGDHLHWSVYRPDGVQVIYSASPAREANGTHNTMVTIYTIKKGKGSKWEDVISPDRITKSREPIKIENAAGKQPAHTMDTTQKVYDHTDESSAAASTPKSRFNDGGDVYEGNITQNALKVKSDGMPEYPTDETLEKLLEGEDVYLPDIEVEGTVTTKTAKQRFQEIKKEEADNNEVISCIMDFGRFNK